MRKGIGKPEALTYFGETGQAGAGGILGRPVDIVHVLNARVVAAGRVEAVDEPGGAGGQRLVLAGAGALEHGLVAGRLGLGR